MRPINLPEVKKTDYESRQMSAQHRLITLGESDLTILNPLLDVRNYKVLDRAGREIGHVNELWIDEKEREVRLLQVAHGGLWGWGESRVLIPSEAVTAVEAGVIQISSEQSARENKEIGDYGIYHPELIARSEEQYGDNSSDDSSLYSRWSTCYIYPGYPPLV